MLKVYAYDKNTKEYTGVEFAQENPKRKGDYIMPANTTTVQVNKYEKGFVPVFDGDGWVLKKDLHAQDEDINLNENAETESSSELRKKEILYKLKRIDDEAVRPIRAKLTGKASQEDEDKLLLLEEQAEGLRQELKESGGV